MGAPSVLYLSAYCDRRIYCSALIAARVKGPKKPTAGVMPFAFWYAMTAALVRPPKKDVSLPGEPGPEEATVKPLALRSICRALTCSPSEPTVRSDLNAATALLVTEPFVAPSSEAFTFATTDASAPNQARTSRTAWICAAERPPEAAEGVAGTSGVALPPPPPPLPLEAVVMVYTAEATDEALSASSQPTALSVSVSDIEMSAV